MIQVPRKHLLISSFVHLIGHPSLMAPGRTKSALCERAQLNFEHANVLLMKVMRDGLDCARLHWTLEKQEWAGNERI